MLRIGAALAAVIAISGPVVASAQPGAPSTKVECFLSRNWTSWKPSADSKSIYIRVDTNRIFRLDLTTACPVLQSPSAYLITRSRGSSWICHPLDIDLKVSDRNGARTSCLVSGITRLTPEQVAALPKKLRP